MRLLLLLIRLVIERIIIIRITELLGILVATGLRWQFFFHELDNGRDEDRGEGKKIEDDVGDHTDGGDGFEWRQGLR